MSEIEKSPELKEKLDKIMESIDGIVQQITNLTKEEYITEHHKTTLVLATYNVGDMISNCIEYKLVMDALKKFDGEKHGN